jgi:putative SOS response-associated peptidase YedK
VCISYQFENGEAHPGQPVPVIREFDGPMESLHMRWGLIPYAARGIAGETPVIHAPLQELSDSHIYRGPWVNGQRCLQLATSFQIWKADREGRRACFRVRPVDGGVFSLAGLWDRSQSADGGMIESCAMVTLPGGMPAILRPADQAVWLTGTTAQAAALLRPFPAAGLHLTPV